MKRLIKMKADRNPGQQDAHVAAWYAHQRQPRPTRAYSRPAF